MAKKQQKVLGYGYRLSRESFSDIESTYGMEANSLHHTVESVKRTLSNDKKEGFIGKNSKPKLFRVIIEEIDE